MELLTRLLFEAPHIVQKLYSRNRFILPSHLVVQGLATVLTRKEFDVMRYLAALRRSSSRPSCSVLKARPLPSA